MTALHDTGWAKINLTLVVLGRRPDFYHELESLVAFAGLGDEIELEPVDTLALSVEGCFADALSGDNLIIRAAEAASGAAPGLRLGRFRLVKSLPVAAGLGGGSADAAAVLRLIARANQGALSEAALAELAPQLGSDVSVCLTSRPALMSGRGEQVRLVEGFPACGVVLANPGLPLASGAVYAELRAGPLAASPRERAEPPDFQGDFERLIAYVLPRGNDLEAPAARLVPEVREVLASLGALEGVRLARLSGSGPTCFALFATEEQAKRAAATLGEEHPAWWIAATRLGV